MARLLIVDDDADFRDFMETALRRAGHDVECVSDGAAALKHVQRSPVDLVVTDIFMPHSDGIELSARLRAEFASLPVIGVTGGAPDLAAVMGRAMVASGTATVLKKPFSARELVDEVERTLGQKPPPGAATPHPKG
jgi:DNA-binding response OmpR family regulator